MALAPLYTARGMTLMPRFATPVILSLLLLSAFLMACASSARNPALPVTQPPAPALATDATGETNLPAFFDAATVNPPTPATEPTAAPPPTESPTPTLVPTAAPIPTPTLTPVALDEAGIEADTATLETFYWAMQGDQWEVNFNWLRDEPLDTWWGVDTDSSGRVVRLDLHRNRLRGELPHELGDLTELKYLNLSINYIEGEIPIGMGGLSKLEFLDISRNNLTGGLPAQLDGMSSLRYLYLWSNELCCPIPAELGNLSNLRVLDLWNNGLNEAVPKELGNLSNLEILDVGCNLLRQEIPQEVQGLPKLRDIDIDCYGIREWWLREWLP